MIGTSSQRGWIASIRQVIVVAGLSSVAAGCGAFTASPAGRLQGRVTSEGLPAREGTVCVYSADLGAGGSAALGADGAYAIPEPLRPGRYSVAILPPSEPPTEEDTAASPGKVSPGRDYGIPPAKYRDPKRSGLVVDIEPGDNTFDVDMTK
jgi:hypothetical protein